MRLTLRTLLAYLDGILDPKDHEELAKQIETSDNAKELIHRTGDTVRRIRLGAPPVDSPTHDTNAVAEYLDGTMSPQDVVEFERRCLESDPELAEAASCHHVLKMVLAERAEVDDDLRRVMYGLPAQHAAEQRAQPVVERPGAESTAGSAQVPDYLRASSSPLFWRLAPAVGAVAVLAVAAWIFGPEGLYDQASRSDPNPEPTQPEPSNNPGGAASTEAPIGEPATPGVEAEREDAEGRLALGVGVDSPTGLKTAEEDAAVTVSGPPPASPVETAVLPEGPGVEGDAVAPDPADDAATGSAEPASAAAVLDSGLADLPADEGVGVSGSGGSDPAEGGRVSEAPKDPASVDAQPDEPAEPVEVGMVSTPREVLLKYEENTRSWRRLAFGEAGALPSVVAGDRLLSLPYFRPVITIKGLNVNLSGASLVEVGASSANEGRAAVRLIYGRVVLQNTGGEASAIELQLGDRTGVATLERGAVLAVSAARPFQAGRDPMVDPAPLIASYYVPAGGVVWRGAGGDLAVTSGSVWREVDGRAGPVEPFGEGVDWLSSEPLTNIQQQVAAEMSQTLESGEPIWPQLEALKNARRIEHQVFAAIASMYVGHYRPSIRALSDGEQQSVWAQEIEALRSTMFRSPELARAVRDALVDERGDRYAGDLYRMLCGFTPEEVGQTREERRAGVLGELIDWLESDQLDYRVLANHNLEQITGRRGVFNPAGFLRSRESKISRFRNRLESGDLVNRAER